MKKNSMKKAIGITALSAFALFTAGVIYELGRIRQLTIDHDDLPEQETEEDAE